MSLLTSTKKTLKWFTISIVAIVIVVVAYSIYLFYSFDTETLPEGTGLVNAELFLGDGENQPLIVGFGGAEGGNAWASDYWKPQRDKFIEQGYAFLAIAYFGEAGIPEVLDRISIDGVHDAIMAAAENPRINAECIAVMGGSKGAELALLLSSHFADIKAVVGIVPGNAVFAGHTSVMNTASFSLDGEQLPFVPVPMSALPAIAAGDLRSAWEAMLEDDIAVQNAVIPVENINGPVFLLSATQDEFWPSTEMSHTMVNRLERNNFPHYYEHVAIEGSHSAPLDHMNLIEGFLNDHFYNENTIGCAR